MQKIFWLILITLFISKGVAAYPKTDPAKFAGSDAGHSLSCRVNCPECYRLECRPRLLKLSLSDAILLGVRSNPNVQSSRLNYLSSKFNFWVQKWAFLPHYNLSTTAGLSKKHSNGNDYSHSQDYDIKPSASLLTSIGTQITLSASNTKNDHYNPGLSAEIVQPLMRGFGRAVVETALCNARDSLITSGLAVEGMLRTTVTNIINAYLDVVSAQKTIEIDKAAVTRAEQSVSQTKLFIKAGHKAGNELVTVEANVAAAKSQLENDKNNLAQARYALLTAIGLDPNTPVEFLNLNVSSLLNKYHEVPLVKTKELVLLNDIQYQTDNIALHGSQARQLLVAKDQARPQLNLTINAGSGNGSGGGWNSGFNSLFNGVNHSRSVGLTLQVPIDDQLLKQSIVNAKIALQQAQLAFVQEKWSKETSAINGWNLVRSTERAMRFAEDAEHLQNKTYNVSYQKYLHGLIDSLELQSAQDSLIKSQQTLLSAQINYLKALVNLDLLTGRTLKTWDIQVRL